MGEWANIIMMPSLPTLATYKELTNNFRTGYMAVAHDVMLRRMKKAAVKYAQKTRKEMQQDLSEEEDEKPKEPVLQTSRKAPSKYRQMVNISWHSKPFRP